MVVRHSSSHWGAIEAHVEDGRLTAVKPFAKDSNPSPIINSLAGAVYHRSRIERPMVRAGYLADGIARDRAKRGAEPFVPVSWDKALALVAAELARVKATHGNEAIYAGSYGWGSAGRLHNACNLLHRFLNLFGGFTDSVGSYSCAAAEAVVPHILGDFNQVLKTQTDWRSIAENSRLVLAFGGMPPKNSQIASGGQGNHGTRDWLKRAHQSGVEFVYVGPVMSDMADFLGAEWIRPRPNSDTALMLGMAHTLLAEGLHDRAFLDRYTTGFERFRAYLMGESDGRPKTADWVSALTGLEAETIRGLARRMAGARSMITISWSLQRGDHGEQSYWAAITLAAMLGQIGLPGGGIGFGYSNTGNMGAPAEGISRQRIPEGENPIDRFIPVARIADMLLNPGTTIDFDGQRITYPDIRLIYWAGGNPFHHHQDLNRFLGAWRKPETVIVHEPWWTPLARYADIVLPATTTFERNDIGGATRDPFILAMQKAIEPVAEARDDYRIFADLAARFGIAEAFTEGRSEMEWLRHFYEADREQLFRRNIDLPEFESFWAAGHVELPAPDQPIVFLEAFRRAPDLYPLPTPSGKIEIFSEKVASFGYDDCPGHAAWIEPAEWLGSPLAARYPLHLISNQPSTRLHSQLDIGVVSGDGKVKGREPVWIHPSDAAPRGIADGDIVRVFNDRGAVLAAAVVTERVQPCAIQLATGAWYDPESPGAPGSLCKHGNPNVLTLDKGTSRLGQGPSAHSCLVDVAPWRGPVPEVTAFEPPIVLAAAAGDPSA
ncbi:MAG TPA: molybdopterin guanine dinucleotide-containing S/N-oxide reductase [Dongiaceae bacterium]|nr:molybdopterin guanine dinucleotide-containing S/N-oxide reductase [Dongiaceae bacterium]